MKKYISPKCITGRGMSYIQKCKIYLHRISDTYIQKCGDTAVWKIYREVNDKNGIRSLMDIRTQSGLVNAVMISGDGKHYTNFQIWDEHAMPCFFNNHFSFFVALCWLLQVDPRCWYRV